MPGGAGKGFFDRTWADTFNETRNSSNDTTPISLPYGRHILEIEGRGGRGSANAIEPAYQISTNYPLTSYSEPAYQVTSAAYSVTDSYPARYTSTAAYSVSANYPVRYTSPTGPNTSYSVTADYPARYLTQPAFETSTSQPATYYREPASEFASYYLEPAYFEDWYAVYAYFPTTYGYNPPFETSYFTPAEWTYQAPFETAYTSPPSFSYYSIVFQDPFSNSYLAFSQSAVTPGSTSYADHPATWTKTPGSTVYADNPGSYFIAAYGGTGVQAVYPERSYPNSWYATYYNQPNTYYLEAASTSYADHPATWTITPGYEGTTNYPARLQTQHAAYTGYYTYPIRYNSEAAYTVSYQYPARTTTFPARFTTSGGYSVQTTYPARYFAGVSGEDTLVSISAVDGTTYQFVAEGSTTPAMGNYSQPAQPSVVSATVYATEVTGVYQSSVTATVGASPAGPSGYIRIKYDADV